MTLVTLVKRSTGPLTGFWRGHHTGISVANAKDLIEILETILAVPYLVAATTRSGMIWGQHIRTYIELVLQVFF